MSLAQTLRVWRFWGPWLLWLPLAGNAVGAELRLPSEGWATWRVAAVAGAPDWCCFEGQVHGQARVCPLDGRASGYSNDSERAPVDHMQIYARLKAGRLERIRAYGPDCAVAAKTSISDLGDIAADTSARWLATQIASGERGDDVLAALATHAGAVAEAQLVAAAQPGSEREIRKQAIFWLGQLRGASGARQIETFLSADADAQIREHAAFALSQSQSPRRSELLIQQAKVDASRQVRAQAWFWLAQTGAAATEDAIRAALQTEPSQEVRHQAIFALSQLPEERGIRALIALIEDRAIKLDARKQALFWLGQSESELAQRYLARVLGA